MKIRELLANTLQLAATRRNYPWANFKTTPYLFELERRLTWSELDDLFNLGEQEATPQNLQLFVNFLERRWQRIQHLPQLHYSNTYQDELTQVCKSLAQELQTGHHLQLLMPTVNFYNENLMSSIVELDQQTEDTHVKQSYMDEGADIGLLIQDDEIKAAVENQLTAEQISLAKKRGIELAKAEKIDLHHFVIDDKNMIIHIGDCLNDAKCDGRVKHTNKLPRSQNAKLAMKELNQVIYSSKQAKALNDAVVKFWEKRKKSNSVGGHLNRLIEGMFKAGEEGGFGGTDEQPDDLIFGYIEEFHFLTKLLKPAELEELLSIDAVRGDNVSFRYYWYRLLQVYPVLLSSAELATINTFIEKCKELEADQLENRLLGEIAADIAEARENVVHQRVTITIDYESARCDTPCIEIFANNLNAMLNEHFELYYMVPESYIENEERDLQQVKENFEQHRDQLHEAVVENKLTRFSIQELNIIFSTHNQKFNATNPLPALGSESPLIKKLCSSMINTPDSLIGMFAIVPERHHRWMLTQYLEVSLKAIINAQTLTYILLKLAQKAQMV
ncbi:MAG: hypothetical protein V4501_04750 [Pseudomonadota bacterium]